MPKPRKLCYKRVTEINNAKFQTSEYILERKILEAKKAHNKQHNICFSVIKKAKNLQFQNINSSGITDSKKFWTTVNSLIGNKVKTNHRIILI